MQSCAWKTEKNPQTAASLQKQQIMTSYYDVTLATSLYQSFYINQMLSHVYPGAFQTTEVMEQLIAFVKHRDDIIGKLHGWYSKFKGQRHLNFDCSFFLKKN